MAVSAAKPSYLLGRQKIAAKTAGKKATILELIKKLLAAFFYSNSPRAQGRLFSTTSDQEFSEPEWAAERKNTAKSLLLQTQGLCLYYFGGIVIFMSGEQHNQEAQLERSPNWERFKDSSGFIEEGFPFNEGFPSGASPFGDSVYTVIFRDGQRLRARVDFSTQYRAEGLTWRIQQPAEFNYLDRHVIVAWCEVPVETDRQRT